MRCPNCGMENCIKNGKVLGKQRYRCKECKKNYTKDVSYHSTRRCIRTKRKAVVLYINGKSFGEISKRLKVTKMGVEHWLKELEQKIFQLDDIFAKKYFSKQVQHNLKELKKKIEKNGWASVPHLNLRKFDEYTEDLRKLID